MPSPYYCKRYHHTCGCGRRKSLFLNFADWRPIVTLVINAKVAAPGFERETLLVIKRALASVATVADLGINLIDSGQKRIILYLFP